MSNCVVMVAFNTYSFKIHIMSCEYIYIYMASKRLKKKTVGSHESHFISILYSRFALLEFYYL